MILLVATCGKNGFRLVSEKDSPTFLSSRGFKTTIDLTWANFLASRLATSTSTSSNNHGSNHQKLVTTIALAAPKPIFHVVAPKATAVDQDLFRKTLQSNLSQLSTQINQLPIYQAEEQLTSSIFDAWQAQGRKTCINPARAKKWWEKDTLDPLVKIQNKCRRLLIMSPSPENAEQFNY
ncbi:hypothetical protein PCASD_09361 [Puccinia coronata f. sp. avenae]|uniref:Endonuclease/exonuclease/phosphatase domain-containing protein n=1 Tax=Puccinia coronata f. sp. avenae TaxID=200324 RepID=A0A2N5V178_9BASI|nr:hypothetical protein PCASD_09361 [Puccinia coronata f. sp. avenae]